MMEAASKEAGLVESVPKADEADEAGWRRLESGQQGSRMIRFSALLTQNHRGLVDS